MAVRAWQQEWAGDERPTLTYWSSPGLLVIEDLRAAGRPLSYAFEGPLASLYLACVDFPRSAAAARESAGIDLTADEAQEALLELESCGLVMQDGNLFLSLALPATRGQ